MKITYAPSFWKSLKKISKHRTWWYKTYEFFRYKLGFFFKNLWLLKKELYEYRQWDSRYSLSLFRRGLELLCNNIEKYGYEVDESRLKKINKMKRAIEILKWHENDFFMELSEKELGYEVDCSNMFNPGDDTDDVKEKNRKIFNLSEKIEEDSFNELIEILKGQNYKEFKDQATYYEQFDGSGIKSWWN